MSFIRKIKKVATDVLKKSKEPIVVKKENK